MLADALEELGQLLIRKLQAHRLAATKEVLRLGAAMVGGVKGLVGLLDGDPAFLELRPELAQEGITVVKRCLQLQAASLGKCFKHSQEVHVLHRRLQSGPFC